MATSASQFKYHRLSDLLTVFSSLLFLDTDSEPEVPPAQLRPKFNKLDKTWQAQAPGHCRGTSLGLLGYHPVLEAMSSRSQISSGSPKS